MGMCNDDSGQAHYCLKNSGLEIHFELLVQVKY